MNENDKILINAYLDGEASESEKKYIESLIKSSNEVNEYANKIKNTNNQFESFFNSKDKFEIMESTNKFISAFANKKKSLNYEIFQKMFNRYSFVGYSFLILFTALSFNDGKLLPKSDFDELNLNENLNTYSIEKYRNESQSDLDEIISSAIEMMLTDKTRTGILLYGTDSFYIEINDLIYLSKENNNYCVYGSYLEKEIEKDFYYCKTKIDEEIIYTI